MITETIMHDNEYTEHTNPLTTFSSMCNFIFAPTSYLVTSCHCSHYGFVVTFVILYR